MNRKNKLADYFLDITAEVCPITFVKARLHIEKMTAGEIGDEPLKNVPDSLTELGHRIVTIDRVQPDSDLYTLVIEKK